jgi:hypothetical protein
VGPTVVQGGVVVGEDVVDGGVVLDVGGIVSFEVGEEEIGVGVVVVVLLGGFIVGLVVGLLFLDPG